MLVWLASYPRSGNTLLRMIIRQLQGTGTYSLYDDRLDIGADPALAEVVGHLEHGKTEEEFVDWARSQPGLIFVKSHEHTPPRPEDPAIYIVRDGRAAAFSYWRYHRTILGHEIPLMDVIRGDVFAGHWSGHVLGWLGKERPGPTLVIRYEDLAADPAREWDRIRTFLALTTSPGRIEIDFAQLHHQFPHFFRSGSNEVNVSGMTPDELGEFDRLHGPTMGALGYGSQLQERPEIDRAKLRSLAMNGGTASPARLQGALRELSVARAIAEYQTDIAERMVALRVGFAEALAAAVSESSTTASDERYIAAETAREALADLASLEAIVQDRLAVSRARLTAAAGALKGISDRAEL